jgi:hypothetical protein
MGLVYKKNQRTKISWYFFPFKRRLQGLIVRF